MKEYFDLHINPEDPNKTQEMIELASLLGFSNIAVTSDQIKGTEISVYTRINVEASNRGELLDKLQKARKNYDVVAVYCNNKEVSRQAGKDSRVDVLLFPSDPSHRRSVWLDRQEAELAEATKCAFEINISEILMGGSIRTSKLLSIMRRELQNAISHDLPILLSSGAVHPLFQREPRALTALASLLDIDDEFAKDMITEIPFNVLEKGKSKRTSSGRKRR